MHAWALSLVEQRICRSVCFMYTDQNIIYMLGLTGKPEPSLSEPAECSKGPKDQTLSSCGKPEPSQAHLALQRSMGQEAG